jgi:hypothetical protein
VPDPARGATCVRYALDALDRAGSLELDERGLACDAPDGALIVKLSWRGDAPVAPASLPSLFQAWIDGFRAIAARR